jgi:hypothetical protein
MECCPKGHLRTGCLALEEHSTNASSWSVSSLLISLSRVADFSFQN